jgi:hypothetical protein
MALTFQQLAAAGQFIEQLTELTTNDGVYLEFDGRGAALLIEGETLGYLITKIDRENGISYELSQR